MSKYKNFREFLDDAKSEGVKVPVFLETTMSGFKDVQNKLSKKHGDKTSRMLAEMVRDNTARVHAHDFTWKKWRVHMCMSHIFRLSLKYGLHIGPFHIHIVRDYDT